MTWMPLLLTTICLQLVDRELLARIRQLARTRGLTKEGLVNLLLEQPLQQVAVEQSVRHYRLRTDGTFAEQ